MTVQGGCLHQDRESSKAGCAVSWLLRAKKELRHRSWTLCHQRRGGGVDNGDRGNKRWLTLTLQTPFCRSVFRAPPSRGPALQCRWTPALAGAGTAGTAVQLSMCAIWQQPHSFNETDRHPSRASGTRPAAKVQTYLPLRRTLPPKRRDDPPWTAAPLHAPPLHEPSQP